MTPPKRRSPAAPPEPVPPVEVSVAALQERVDNFHDKTFPDFCTGLRGRLDQMDKKLDKAVLRNGEFDKVKTMAEEWEKSSLRREGAVTVLRLSWKALAWAAGFAAATGLIGSGFFWLLGLLTGHI
jgi:hypothetical protein